MEVASFAALSILSVINDTDDHDGASESGAACTIDKAATFSTTPTPTTIVPSQSAVQSLAKSAMENPADQKKKRRRRPRKRTRQAFALNGGFWPRTAGTARDTIWPQKLLINVSMARTHVSD